MIDPRTDPAAIEEIIYLGERLPTPELRRAIDKLILAALTRSFKKVRAQHGQNQMTPRRESQFIEDFIANIGGSFRDSIGAKVLQRDRTVLPLVSADPAFAADRGAVPCPSGTANPPTGAPIPGRRAPLQPGADL